MNKKSNNPSELARETLKTLATRKIPPTPDSYTKIYAEISGTTTEENNGAEKVLYGIAERLAQTPLSASAGAVLKKTISAGNWTECLKEIEKILPKQGDGDARPWANLIRDLLRQLETTHKGLTVTRKKEGLETVLKRFAGNPEALFEKLTGLMRSWSGSPVVAAEAALPEAHGESGAAHATATVAPGVQAAKTQTPASDTELSGKLSELLVQTLEVMLSSQPQLAQDLRVLVQQVRNSKSQEQLAALTRQLHQFLIKAELQAIDNTKIHEGLLRLLRLLVENIGEMIEDEDWLHGQIAILQEIIAKPVDRHAIADAERGLRDAIIKQSLLKQSLTEAKVTLKNLMTTFIDRLGEITESTGEYHHKIEGYSQKISKSSNITELSHLLQDIMQDTRIIQASALRSHEELVDARKQVHQAENKIKQLEQQLNEVSELVREDQLTGALNRRGMDAAFENEATRADRHGSKLCVALLDIDNFKRLNDTLGHQAGDQALIHLSDIIKETLRPSDSVARYGGEEFVILLPDIGLDEAMTAMERLQRTLTKKLFLHENERLLITFSAGVALRAPNENQEDVIGRADAAMYKAKHTGKNRVVKAN